MTAPTSLPGKEYTISSGYFPSYPYRLNDTMILRVLQSFTLDQRILKQRMEKTGTLSETSVTKSAHHQHINNQPKRGSILLRRHWPAYTISQSIRLHRHLLHHCNSTFPTITPTPTPTPTPHLPLPPPQHRLPPNSHTTPSPNRLQHPKKPRLHITTALRSTENPTSQPPTKNYTNRSPHHKTIRQHLSQENPTYKHPHPSNHHTNTYPEEPSHTKAHHTRIAP